MYKVDPKYPVEEQKVIPVPEIRVQKITKETPFFVVACDGIWDCVTSQECIDFFKDKIQ